MAGSMTLAARGSKPRPSFAVRSFRPFRRILLLAAALLSAVGIGSTTANLQVLAPTGSHSVGRDRVVLTDTERAEPHTADPLDHRSVPVQLWYPAQPGSGNSAPYVDDLTVLSDALVESGALSRLEVTGLRWVRTAVLDRADVANGPLPVIVLSPGNQTNVGFYSSVAEDLASHGYLVIGVDHAYQVAATVLADGTVAAYDETMDLGPPGTTIDAKIDE